MSGFCMMATLAFNEKCTDKSVKSNQPCPCGNFIKYFVE